MSTYIETINKDNLFKIETLSNIHKLAHRIVSIHEIDNIIQLEISNSYNNYNNNSNIKYDKLVIENDKKLMYKTSIDIKFEENTLPHYLINKFCSHIMKYIYDQNLTNIQTKISVDIENFLSQRSDKLNSNDNFENILFTNKSYQLFVFLIYISRFYGINDNFEYELTNSELTRMCSDRFYDFLMNNLNEIILKKYNQYDHIYSRFHSYGSLHFIRGKILIKTHNYDAYLNMPEIKIIYNGFSCY